MTEERVTAADFAGPLEGRRVVEIGDRGEVAGKLLADAGAEVVYVEPREGGRSRNLGPFAGDRPDVNASLLFAARNTSKRSVTLDLASADGVELWGRLVRWAEVVIDSSGPPDVDGALTAAARYEAFADHAGLIWCSITPFGTQGPWHDWAATDLSQLALGGPMMSTGYDDHDLPPIRSDGEHSIAMAGEYAVSGILAALWLRDHAQNATGRGQFIDVSVHEAVGATTEGSFPNWEFLGQLVQRQTGRHAATVRSGDWQHRGTDGDYVLLMGGGVPRSKDIWDNLLEWMDEHEASHELRSNPEYEDVLFRDPRMAPEVRRRVVEEIGRFVRMMPVEETYRRGQSLHLPWGKVRRPEQNLDDPHWADREFYWEGDVPGHPEPVKYPGAPYRFTKSPVRMRRRPPLLAEHNHEVFVGDLSLSEDELKRFVDAGVI
jgi:crotonobetainyl-CoA:carnitine CoA-transferase CaiB-like acyl-CoA transferase